MACPLCGERDHSVEERIPYGAIWDALSVQFGARFDADVIARHSPAEETELRACAGCGLQWFWPLVAGEATFYEHLMGAAGYEDSRWEFDVVCGRVSPTDAVVDFGCGDGAFLRMVAQRAARAVGVDHNESGIAALRAAGVEGHAGDFGSFATAHRGAFDVACAFQVLEHLPDVAALLEPMVTVLRPGGRLFVGVPNADRGGQRGLEPFDCPPHHLTRWRAAQLPVLARRFGLELVGVDTEPPHYTLATEWAMAPLERVVRGRSGPLVRVARSAWYRLAIGPRRYRAAVRAGLFERRGLHGHGLLAELAYSTQKK